MPHRYRAYLCLAAAMATVGSTVVASKIIGVSLAPFTATALRFAIALPVFVLLMLATRKRWPRPDLHDCLLLIAQAVAGSVGYTVLLIAGTRLAAASDAGVLLGTLPAVAALVSMALLRERLALKMLIAIALATSGVIVVASAHPEQGNASSLLGNALVLGAVFCESIFILLNKRLHVPLPPLTLSCLMAGLGLVVAIPFAAWELRHGASAPQASALISVVYYALIPTVLGFWLWYAGAAQVSGAEASLFTAVAPVSGVVLSAALLGESISHVLATGLGLVVGSVILTALPARKRSGASNCAKRKPE